VLGAACGSSGKGGETPTPPSTDGYVYNTLVWSDEFDGTGQPSAANWNYHVGNGWNAGAFAGWGNGEWEWYRPDQCYVQDGKLVLRADWASSPTNIGGLDWYQRSCRITTQGKKSWANARIEARIAMPSKVGAWPAFWMMGSSNDGEYTDQYAPATTYYDKMSTNWASCGEIDIMEHVNTDTFTYQNLFWDTRVGLYPWQSGNPDSPGTADVGDVTEFHTYSVELTPTQLYWYIDGVRVKSKDVTAANMEEFRDKEFFVILDLALAGSFPGTKPVQTDFPLYMYVDYVRVYQ
jgi:beta-glucanase (GH16 family)